MYRILIVEDDRTIAQLLAEYLQRWGFDAEYAEDFSDVTGTFLTFQPHLVLLDISLPFYDGYYWCAEIRKRSKVPVLFLSSRTENMDIVMAMNMGGDDYIVKPFSMEVVVAKIHALLRRAYSYQGETTVLTAQGAVLELGAGVLNVGGAQIELTKNELKILRILMEHKNSVVTREEIMQNLWDSGSFVDDNTLTVNINRLRKKLSKAGLHDFIATKKGVGYWIHD